MAALSGNHAHGAHRLLHHRHRVPVAADGCGADAVGEPVAEEEDQQDRHQGLHPTWKVLPLAGQQSAGDQDRRGDQQGQR
jgi:hypothetical protein